MTNAELIKALRRCSYMTVAEPDREDGYCKPCAYFAEDASDITCIDRIMIDAADALEAADKRIEELEAQMPKWVSVEDKLPEESGEYTVYIQMGTGVEVPDFLGSNDLSYVTSVYFKKRQKLWFDEYEESYNADLSLVDTANDFHVTHWMELPEPPKGE